jgi:DNA polymerase-3 subunit epsilon
MKDSSPSAEPISEERPLLSDSLLAHYRRISTQLLTVVDVETTGSRSDRDRITEISLLQADLDSGIRHQHTDFVNAGVAVPDYITKVTGISTAMLANAPATAELLPQYLPLLAQGTFTAHHAAFDLSFLQAEYRRLGITFVRPWQYQCCTVELSRLLLSHLPSRRLPALVRHFRFPVDTSHRAEADTLACWLLAQRLLSEIQAEPDEVLLQRFASQHLSISAAAEILGCSGPVAKARLETADIRPLYANRRGTPFYLRGSVEMLYWQLEEAAQLSG